MMYTPMRRRVALRRSILSSVNPLSSRGRAAFFEPLETRRLLSVAPTFTPAIPSAGYYNAILHQSGKSPKATFVGPVAELGSVEGGSVAAPGLITTVEGITFDEDGANNSGVFSSPADPNGAVGATHLVSVVNSSIEFHTKAGVQQFSDDLQGFFSPLAPVNDPFLPKVIYDTYNSRFVVVALDVSDTTQGGASNTSHILVAVSDDSDPNGVWRHHSINSMLTIGAQARWADLPNVGIDGQAGGAGAIYITANMFSFGLTPAFAGSRLWIVNKTPFYTAPGPNQASVTQHDPATAAGLPGPTATIVPAEMIGAVPANMGTFLVSNSTGFGVNESISVIRITNPLGAIAWSNTFVSLGDVHNETVAMPNAPQSGSAMLIDAGNQLVTDAVWRNNALYVVNSVNPKASVDATNAGQATVHWTKLNATGVAAPSLADKGTIGGEELGAGTFTFFPSVAVDSVGDMAIGFAASSSTIFPGAYYTGRSASGPVGMVQPVSPLAVGLAPYVRTFGGPENRWGDYSGAVNDPSDDSFWVFNAYADTQGTPTNPPPEDGRWRTRWGNFTFIGVTPPIPGAPDLDAASDSGLSNTDDITNDNMPTFTGTGVDGNTIKIFVNAVQVATGLVSGGVYNITIITPLLDGLKSVTAVQSNGTNDSAPSPALAVTIDTTAPAVVVNTPTFNYFGPTAPHSLVYFFTEGVNPSLTTADLTVTRLPSTVEPTSLMYAGGVNPATFTFPSAVNGSLAGILPDGRYTAALNAAGITDVAGNTLAPPMDFAFFFLQGDANHDGFVNVNDFTILATNFGRTGRNFSQANFNYDGFVNVNDFTILASRFGTSLPAPAALSAHRSSVTALRVHPVASDRRPEDDIVARLLA